jgi:malate dehydrogenase
VIGASGIEKIIEITLTPEEGAAFKKSADAVQELVALL